MEFKITQIIYTWQDGREEVRYERPYGSDMAKKLMDEVDELKAKYEDCCYSYKHI